MAYIYGSPEQSHVSKGSARHLELFLRVGLPLVFLLILTASGLYTFLNTSYAISALFAVVFVAAVIRFEELGLTIAHYTLPSETNARAEQIASRALSLLPNDYHVFHDLNFRNVHIDHVVVGPNGIFLINTKSQLGKVTLAGESLRFNGWPFLRNMLSHCWGQTLTFNKHMEIVPAEGMEITPIICFSRAAVDILRPVRGVYITQASTLVPMIQHNEQAVPGDKAHDLIVKLAVLVCGKPDGFIISQPEDDAEPDAPGTGGEKSRRPVCSKCQHQASFEEMALFPDECPRCGRLYAFKAEDVEPALPDPRRAAVWRPSAAQLFLVSLLIAGGAAAVAYRTGFIDKYLPWRELLDIGSTNGTTASKDIPVTPPGNQTAAPEAVSAANATLTAANQTSAPMPEVNATASNSSALVANATGPKNAVNATAIKGTAAQEQEPAPPSDKGKLRIRSAKTTVVWIMEQQTLKQYGPFQVVASTAKDIVIPKGSYTIFFLENGKRKMTSISFMSDHGELEL